MATTELEREVKLDADLRFEMPDLSTVSEVASVIRHRTLRLMAAYYDTPDLRLLRRGITLRRRQDRLAGGENLWTLKLPVETSHAQLARNEHSWPGELADVPPEARFLVRGLVRRSELVMVAKLLTTRRSMDLVARTGEHLMAVDDDVVAVVSGVRQGLRFREIEVEVSEAADAVVESVVGLLGSAGASPGESRPKLDRAVGLNVRRTFDVDPADAESTVEDLIRFDIATGLDRLLDHDPGIRVGGADIEYVHQARVATRRLRSDLKTFADLLEPAWIAHARDELKWLGAMLGAVRDADVLSEYLARRASECSADDAPAFATLDHELTRQRDQAQAALLAAMESGRYLDLVSDLVAAVALPPMRGTGFQPLEGSSAEALRFSPAPASQSTELLPFASEEAALVHADPGSEPERYDPLARYRITGEDRRHDVDPTTPAAEVLPSLMARPWKKLRREVRDAGNHPTDDQLHQIRIRAKQLRYAAEAAEPVLGRPASKLGERAADLQGVLGDLHDAVTAEAWLRQTAIAGTSAQAFAAGQLVVDERQRQARLRRQWHLSWETVALQAKKTSFLN